MGGFHVSLPHVSLPHVSVPTVVINTSHPLDTVQHLASHTLVPSHGFSSFADSVAHIASGTGIANIAVAHIAAANEHGLGEVVNIAVAPMSITAHQIAAVVHNGSITNIGAGISHGTQESFVEMGASNNTAHNLASDYIGAEEAGAVVGGGILAAPLIPAGALAHAGAVIGSHVAAVAGSVATAGVVHALSPTPAHAQVQTQVNTPAQTKAPNMFDNAMTYVSKFSGSIANLIPIKKHKEALGGK